MTFKVDTDFAIPIVVAFLAITLAIGHQTLVSKSSIASLEAELDTSYITESAAMREVDALTKELQKYQATQQEIIDMGATSEYSSEIIKASEALNANPK
ncbi:MAG: hypothetical protein ACYDD5_00435 [Sulfuricurvum sp.]